MWLGLRRAAYRERDATAFHGMPDVIDSLKRLERIGSEQSKTMQKILEAARDLEETITAQYEV